MRRPIHSMVYVTLPASLAACLFCAGSAVAQEEPPVETPVPAIVAFSVAGEGGAARQVIMAAPAVNYRAEGQPLLMMNNVVGGYVPGDKMGMLVSDQFREELELVDEQMEKLRGLQQQILSKRREMFSSIRTVDASRRSEFLRESQAALNSELEDELKGILLPHQYKRLGQLELQMQMRNRGAGALASQQVADLLGLTEEQQKQLAEKQREAQKKLQEQIAEIRKQLQKDIVEDVLTSQQRKKLQALVGDEFQVKPGENPLLKRLQQPKK